MPTIRVFGGTETSWYRFVVDGEVTGTSGFDDTSDLVSPQPDGTVVVYGKVRGGFGDAGDSFDYTGCIADASVFGGGATIERDGVEVTETEAIECAGAEANNYFWVSGTGTGGDTVFWEAVIDGEVIHTTDDIEVVDNGDGTFTADGVVGGTSSEVLGYDGCIQSYTDDATADYARNGQLITKDAIVECSDSGGGGGGGGGGGCTSDADCASGEICQDGQCVSDGNGGGSGGVSLVLVGVGLLILWALMR